ncbi:uncharacterized protein LOC113521854 [Galleria mellonella]|uniref:Uncharacterized protein LOC113521854 n=1 Tax=Galleria mellonella TaxID=7137 RepID=A0A6J3BWH8_GALME|nr:uncharacterized protein LOC113521854 [Galleria mellonella]
MERCYSDELNTVNTDINILKQQLLIIKNKLSQYKYQISMIDICRTSEMTKIGSQIDNVRCHTKGFEEMFAKEHNIFESYKKELREKEAVEQEVEKQKEREAAEENEQRAKDVANVELECDNIERECVVLKKRNNAVMLKLRRKLIQTENIRRDLLKKN